MNHVFWQHPVVPEIRAQFYAGDRLTGTASTPSLSASLYVDGSSGSDAWNIAAIRAGGGLHKWQTIMRAAVGSSDRNTPDPLEAAVAGDIVSIAGGTYNFSGSVYNRFRVVYNPVNEGNAVSGYITFRADGVVTLTAPSANGPVLGSEGRDYIKWYADVRQGNRWTMVCDPSDSGAATTGIPNNDTKAANTVNPIPDTGPVVLQGCDHCWVEGLDIDGQGHLKDYGDNYDGVRMDGATNFTVRNNRIRNFKGPTGSHNECGVKIYGSSDGLVEHNTITNCGSGTMSKDTDGAGTTMGRTHVRYNHFEDCNETFAFSITNEDGSFFYRNLITNADVAGIFITGAAVLDEWIFNNTFYNCNGGAYFANPSDNAGLRIWNNIFVTTDRVMTWDAQTQEAAAATSWQHNCYQMLSGNFYTGSDGTLSYASYNAAYTDQNVEAPASINTDPLLTNPGALDISLQVGSPCRNGAGTIGAFTYPHIGAWQQDDSIVFGVDD